MQKQWNYYVLNKTKDVSKQIQANPKVEICAFKDGEWLRVAGELVEDDRIEARQCLMHTHLYRTCIQQMMEIQKYFISKMSQLHLVHLHMNHR